MSDTLEPAPADSPLAGPATVPVGTVGTPYSATLVATGGEPPYSYAVTGLPPGLTAAGNQVSGAPESAGETPITVTVTNSTNAQATSNPVLVVN